MSYRVGIITGGRLLPTSQTQWAPTLTFHDPNPPITLESKAATPCSLVASMANFAGGLVKQAGKVVSASLASFVGGRPMVLVAWGRSASVAAFAGGQTRQTSRALSSVMANFSATLVGIHQFLKSLAASMQNFAGGINRLTLKTLAALLSNFAAGATRKTLRSLAGSMSNFAGQTIRMTVHGLGASMAAFAGSVARQVEKIFAAGMATLAGFLETIKSGGAQLFDVVVNASMADFSGALSRCTFKSLVASLSDFAAALKRLTSRAFTASLAGLGGLFKAARWWAPVAARRVKLPRDDRVVKAPGGSRKTSYPRRKKGV